MKAIIAQSSKENPRVVDLPSPRPANGQVLIRVASAGVGLWDPAFLRGEIPEFKAKFPLIPGWEGAGIVAAVGAGVTKFKMGDEIIFSVDPDENSGGTWAQEVVVPEHCIGRKPRSLSLEQAGGLPVIALTAYQALRKAFRLESGQSILICNGAGGVGTCAIQFARSMGARTIALSSPENHSLLKDLGADHVFDYHQDFATELRGSYPQGVDHVFDNIGVKETVGKAIPCLKSGGTFITIVHPFMELQRGDIRSEFFSVEANGKDLDEIADMVDEGKLRLVLDHLYPLEHFREAIEQVENRHVHGKIVLKVAV